MTKNPLNPFNGFKEDKPKRRAPTEWLLQANQPGENPSPENETEAAHSVEESRAIVPLRSGGLARYDPEFNNHETLGDREREEIVGLNPKEAEMRKVKGKEHNSKLMRREERFI